MAGKGCVKIADGAFAIESGKGGIHSENVDDSSFGYLYIADGDFTIQSQLDGLDSKCILKIAGVEISLIASDDGLNAAGGNDQSSLEGRPGMNPFEADADCFIEISGGKLVINASGDGIDSNGTLNVTGGEIYGNDPTNNGNRALDYGGDPNHRRYFSCNRSQQHGTEFGDSSIQVSIMANFQNGQQGSTIALSDSKGNPLFTYIPEKQFQSMVISIPQLEVAQTYTLTVGSKSQSIQLSSVIYGSSGSMMMPGRELRSRPDDQGMPSRPEGQ